MGSVFQKFLASLINTFIEVGELGSGHLFANLSFVHLH